MIVWRGLVHRWSLRHIWTYSNGLSLLMILTGFYLLNDPQVGTPVIVRAFFNDGQQIIPLLGAVMVIWGALTLFRRLEHYDLLIGGWPLLLYSFGVFWYTLFSDEPRNWTAVLSWGAPVILTVFYAFERTNRHYRRVDSPSGD